MPPFYSYRRPIYFCKKSSWRGRGGILSSIIPIAVAAAPSLPSSLTCKYSVLLYLCFDDPETGVYKVPATWYFPPPFFFKSLFSSPQCPSSSPLPLDIIPIGKMILLPVFTSYIFLTPIIFLPVFTNWYSSPTDLTNPRITNFVRTCPEICQVVKTTEQDIQIYMVKING